MHTHSLSFPSLCIHTYIHTHIHIINAHRRKQVWGSPVRFAETVITMYEQTSKTGLGKTLSIEEKVFEDLDELIIG